jgi:uncharacterized membrane protein YhaH (DUF805 family)
MGLMSDTERPPVPQYGEYAPPGYVSPVPEHPMTPVRQDAPAPVRASDVPRWDRTLTLALLVLGALGAFTGVTEGLFLGDRLSQVFELEGLGPFDGDAAVPGIVMWVGHIVLYVAAVALSIARLRAGRRAFWIPLAFGGIAAILFFATGSIAILSDPDFVARYLPGS